MNVSCYGVVSVSITNNTVIKGSEVPCITINFFTDRDEWHSLTLLSKDGMTLQCHDVSDLKQAFDNYRKDQVATKVEEVV